MTVKSAATGIITISALAGNAPVLYDFTSLQTVTVGSGGQTTITFSSIPPTYTHLQIRWLARENTGAQADPSQNIRIRFNSDTGSNYSIHRLYGLGSGSGVADGYASQSDIVSTGFPGFRRRGC